MTTTAVRATRWAGPAAVVVAAVVVPALAGASRRPREPRGLGFATAALDTTPDASPSTDTTPRVTRWPVAVAVARWAGRVALVSTSLLFVLVAVGPHTGRYRTLTVLSSSMQPTLPAGSVVVTTPMPISDVQAGDVITYEAPVPGAGVVTHRVIEVVGPGAVRTRGDANNAPDPWVAQLKGTTAWKVRTDIPALGYAISGLRAPLARWLTVGGTTTLGVLLGLRAIWRRPASA